MNFKEIETILETLTFIKYEIKEMNKINKLGDQNE